MIRRLLRLIAYGRFTPRQAAAFGRALTRGCGYFGAGPVVVIFNLPRRFEVTDPEPVNALDLLNRQLREAQV